MPAQSPKRANRKLQPFRLMIAGQAGLGKTTLLATLFPALFKPPLEEAANGQSVPFDVLAPTTEIISQSFSKLTQVISSSGRVGLGGAGHSRLE